MNLDAICYKDTPIKTVIIMQQKLNSIFQFLKRNDQYNKAVRLREYRRALAGCSDANEKAMALCHFVFNTQPFPNLDKQAVFLKSILGQRT